MRRIVIVGNGIASSRPPQTPCAANGYDGELTLVGDEPHPAYSRPALSKALLRDDADDEAGHLLPPPDARRHRTARRRATGLDVAARTVLLEGGERLPYDGARRGHGLPRASAG